MPGLHACPDDCQSKNVYEMHFLIFDISLHFIVLQVLDLEPEEHSKAQKVGVQKNRQHMAGGKKEMA